MRVLVACEFSGTVRDAFRRRGHDAWSCDLRPSPNNSPWHLQCDVLKVLEQQPGYEWDLMIAHPECTYLTNSAVWALKDPDFARYPGVGYHQRLKPGTLFGKERRQAREDAAQFFLHLYHCRIPRVAIENPTGHMSTRFRPADQIIHPHQFGSDASKATGLWLKNLEPLDIDPAKAVPPRYVCQACGFTLRNGWAGDACSCGSVKFAARWGNQTDSGQNNMTPSDSREATRSTTYPGIADAMAAKWGTLSA